MNTPSKPFTLADGIEVQAAQLADWKRVLAPLAYARLEQWCIAENAKLDEHSCGYDVTRGTHLYEYIANVLMREPQSPSSP